MKTGRQVTLTLAVALALLGGLAPRAEAETYTWVGPSDGSLTAPANWSPAGFGNTVNDVCDITSGSRVVWSGASVTFTSQLNVASASVLTLSSYVTPFTFSNLHLRGGTLVSGSGQTMAGWIAVDNDSTVVAGGSENAIWSAVFSGSGNLSFTNMQPAARSTKINAESTGFTGAWTVNNTAAGDITFGTTAGSVGTGGLVLGPTASNVLIQCDTSCPWDVDVRGKVVSVTSKSGGSTHSGRVTLRSPSVFKVISDYSGKNGVFNGKITGPGKLLTAGVVSTNRLIVLNNASNDFSGGVEVLDYACRAGARNALGTGHVRVHTNAWLFVEASGAMTNSANIYLDAAGGFFGKIYMGSAGVTTTVRRAFVGGLGGWDAPVGYTPLAPGAYFSTTPATTNYLVGAGVLIVSNPPGTVLLLR